MTTARDSTMTFVRCDECSGTGQAYVYVGTIPSSYLDPPEEIRELDVCPKCDGVCFVTLATRDAVASDEDVRLFWNRIGQAHPTPQLVRDALVWFSTRMPSTAKIQPTYYVKHPDGSFSEADMTCLVVMSRSDMAAIDETMQAFIDSRKMAVPDEHGGEVILEHSGCGHGAQMNQLTVKLYPGDKLLMFRGRLGKAMLASQDEVK